LVKQLNQTPYQGILQYIAGAIGLQIILWNPSLMVIYNWLRGSMPGQFKSLIPGFGLK